MRYHDLYESDDKSALQCPTRDYLEKGKKEKKENLNQKIMYILVNKHIVNDAKDFDRW
jgi:hypothetical protein